MGNDNKVSLFSVSCLGQNSNAYNFFSNDNMTLKLHIRTHLDTIFLGFNSFFSCRHFNLFKIARRPFMYGVFNNVFFAFGNIDIWPIEWRMF